VAAIANHAGGKFSVTRDRFSLHFHRAWANGAPESIEQESLVTGREQPQGKGPNSMTKKKATKKAKTKKAKSTGKTAKSKATKTRAAKAGKNSAKRVAVATISSGSEASTLDPKGQLIMENEEEASPRVHKGDLAGDIQGLSTEELYDSESVSELIEEGQDLEAELIEGIEEAPDPDQDEVRVHKAPQKNIPDYKDRNKI
jgi:hypothetical protein